MVSLFDLGNDVLDLIIAETDPLSYRSLALTCSRLSQLCHRVVEKKKDKIKTYHEQINHKMRKKCYYTLPNGEKHGPCNIFIKDQLYLSCSYKDGLLNGKMEKFFSNGCLRLRCHYKSGKLHGKYVKIYPRGIREVYKYRHGKYHGKYKRYSCERIIEEGEYRFGLLLWQVITTPFYVEKYNYRKGKKHGYYLRYLKDKKTTLLEGYYKRGKKWGPWKNHEQNSVQYYVNGRKEGIYRRYYFQDNKIYKKETYVRNKKHGKSIRFDQEGSINKECYYRYGLKEGLCQEYYPEGRIKAESQYRKGKLEGEYKLYDIVGDLLIVEYYHRGRLNGNAYYYFLEKYIDGKKVYYKKCFYRYGICYGEQYWYTDGTCSEAILFYS